MITGVGVDLVNLARFRAMSINHRDRLANRILCESELAKYSKSKNQINILAKHWAVKEAVSKSFGTGIRGTVVWKNILLENTDLGQPIIKFRNEFIFNRIQIK
jgi:holo-[acyl-carrier protein] synthase